MLQVYLSSLSGKGSKGVGKRVAPLEVGTTGKDLERLCSHLHHKRLNLLQVSSSSSSGKGSRGVSKRMSSLELGTIAEEGAVSSRRATKSISWAILQPTGDSTDREGSTAEAQDAEPLLPDGVGTAGARHIEHRQATAHLAP